MGRGGRTVRVPNQLLRETVSIREFGGSGARGPVYSAAREARASMQQTTTLVTDANGAQVTVDILMIIRPEAGPVPAESIVTWAGTKYRVARAYPMPDSRRPSQFELQLIRYAEGAAGSGSGS